MALPPLQLSFPSSSASDAGTYAGQGVRFGNANLTVNSHFWLIVTMIGLAVYLRNKR